MIKMTVKDNGYVIVEFKDRIEHMSVADAMIHADVTVRRAIASLWPVRFGS